MSDVKMLKVTVDGREYSYAEGTTYKKIAADFQENYKYDILLVVRDSKLCELHRTLDGDCTLKFLTAANRHGRQAYERSALFVMLKAFYDVAGRENVDRLTVEFSISNSLFIRAEGNFTLDGGLLEKVEARMRQISEAALPIEKKSVSIEDAAALFEQEGLYRKVKLLDFRTSSNVNIYTLDGMANYFYGQMVPDTSYVKAFALETFENGFVLRLPAQSDPSVVGPFRPAYKVFHEMHAASVRSEVLEISSVADLNAIVCNGGSRRVILAHEAMMEKRIGDIAEEIAKRRDVRFVMIAGPSSSGKTTFSHRLSTQLRACGLRPHAIATDNYFINRDQTPRDENGEYDFESLAAMDVEGFNRDMTRLLRGERVEMPQYNFKKGMREYNGNFLRLGPDDVLVIEGIHCLNDEFSHSLPRESKFKVYISCLTTINIDAHNRVQTTDARLLRRIERDARTRGYGAQGTIKMWPSVRRGEELNIFPFQDSADVIFNSALIYETSLLKIYIEPLLYGIPRGCPEYVEAKRLLKFLSYFMPIPPDDVPRTSIIREFIGGGHYHA